MAAIFIAVQSSKQKVSRIKAWDNEKGDVSKFKESTHLLFLTSPEGDVRMVRMVGGGS